MAKSKRRVSRRKATGKSRAPKPKTKRTVQRRETKEAKWLKGARQRVKRSDSARKGWDTRRERARERDTEQKRRARARRERAEAKAAKEAKRLAKWRKSYREYLKFRVPKAERVKLAIPEKKELVCRVLFDAEEEEVRAEHIWTNLEMLLGHSINRVLSAIPGEEGIVKVLFRLIEGEEFERMQAGTMEEFDEGDGYGVLLPLQWDLDVEPRLFWSAFYANARTLLPARPEKAGQDYKASWLGVVKLELCYAPGEAKEE